MAISGLDDIGRQDHSITREYRIFGPPGTGKTTNLARQVRHAVDKYGVDSVLVTSFSRAAAAEIAAHDLPISSNRIGTLHSHAFHALGAPEIAEANVIDWNRAHPDLRITPVRKQHRLEGEEPMEDAGDHSRKLGDGLLGQLNRHRGLIIDPRLWPASVHDFEREWSRYKRELGLLDFTDLIEICLRDVALAPGRPAVIFADEAQDLNVMQLRLMRQWGGCAEYFIFACDDDQTIYSHTGASPDAILDPEIPEDHTIILTQSERVPRAIHKLADALIRTVTRRKEKAYFPRPDEGSVQRLTTGSLKSTEYFILSSAMKHLEQGKTIMFLASCSYMLAPLIQVLRKNAIPFHNPYRKANGFWNPLLAGARGSTVRRILALLSRHPDYCEAQGSWTFSELALWAESLKTPGVLAPDSLERIQSCSQKRLIPIEDLGDFLKPGAFRSFRTAYARSGGALLDWWAARVRAELHRRIQFAADIARREGPQRLIQAPQVVVGTVHSVKGGQADVVYLFPDLSQAGDANYQRFGASYDSVIRVFYVGMTRARETLYICQRDTAMAVSI
jgi:DNA helicase-2/ATP-dependent DNA helicase PcrA